MARLSITSPAPRNSFAHRPSIFQLQPNLMVKPTQPTSIPASPTTTILPQPTTQKQTEKVTRKILAKSVQDSSKKFYGTVHTQVLNSLLEFAKKRKLANNDGLMKRRRSRMPSVMLEQPPAVHLEPNAPQTMPLVMGTDPAKNEESKPQFVRKARQSLAIIPSSGPANMSLPTKKSDSIEKKITPPTIQENGKEGSDDEDDDLPVIEQRMTEFFRAPDAYLSTPPIQINVQEENDAGIEIVVDAQKQEEDVTVIKQSPKVEFGKLALDESNNDARSASSLLRVQDQRNQFRRRLSQKKVVDYFHTRLTGEVPRANYIDLISETLPLLDNMVSTYKTQLGDKHPFTIGATNYTNQIHSILGMKGVTAVDELVKQHMAMGNNGNQGNLKRRLSVMGGNILAAASAAVTNTPAVTGSRKNSMNAGSTRRSDGTTPPISQLHNMSHTVDLPSAESFQSLADGSTPSRSGSFLNVPGQSISSTPSSNGSTNGTGNNSAPQRKVNFAEATSRRVSK